MGDLEELKRSEQEKETKGVVTLASLAEQRAQKRMKLETRANVSVRLELGGALEIRMKI